MRGAIRVAAAALVGFVLGAGLTLSVQGVARRVEPGLAPPPSVPGIVLGRERPATYLAWTPGGLPPGFADAAEELRAIRRSVAVAADTTWLTGSRSASGDVVDDPAAPFAIPLEVSAVQPRRFAPFLPPVERGVVVALERGLGVLGASSARLRGLGPGAVLRFGGTRVRIAAVLPDELVGATELLVSREVGARIGVDRDRYALLHVRGRPGSPTLARRLRALLPPGLPLRVRAPGETPYFRHGDAVLAPVGIKLLFGEFAARPAPGRPGYLEIDPAWITSSVGTERVPLLGRVTCHRALFPQIRGVVDDLRRRGLAGVIRGFSGCWSPRFVNRVPTASISHHAWGIALDVNVAQNPFGAPPDQDPRLVRTFERWGFVWGGRFVVPDGMHFEYRRSPG